MGLSSSLIENLPWEANLCNIFTVHLPLVLFPTLAHIQEMARDYHICIDRRPAPCHGLCVPQVHKITGENERCFDIFKCLLRAFTTSGCHNVHVASSACSAFKQYWNGSIHFAQNFKTWSSISCAIFGKHVHFLWLLLSQDHHNFQQLLNPASNPQPSIS